MSSAEFAFWKHYRDTRGFPADRIEAAVAKSGAAMARSWGSRVEPKDLLLKVPRPKVGLRMLAGWLAAQPGAKVRWIPRPDRKPRAKAGGGEEQPSPRSRLLSPGKGTKRHRKNGRK